MPITISHGTVDDGAYSSSSGGHRRHHHGGGGSAAGGPFGGYDLDTIRTYFSGM